ncbi:MAG: potassium transporter TrkG [Oliverpabstia sp.]|nr:Trk family potassium uptake protein [Lachnospiraceae bacterium]MDY5025236.1 potassium transporter TrkG [Oliverpabstia sp.]
MKSILRRKKRLTSFQVITIGFLSVILAGSILLMLPVSSKSGHATSFLDALFTATSATCVTGLVVHDTATYWSGFGQLIILLLIQTGGMGVVTIAVALTAISGRKIGLMQRSTMQEAIAAPSVGGVVKLTGFIFRSTLLIELTGALLMLPVFWKECDGLQGIWYAIFHSISAFCNAGFDLMGNREPFSSLTGYVANGWINMIIMGLIIIGGIGFLTWEDVRYKGIHFRKYRMQSKVILVMTAVLIIFPFFLFYFGEFGRTVWNDLSKGEKIWGALFQTVTPRTAGFNTVDLTLFTEAGKTVMILLMLIGGSPGSTAGGMKTTTAAVLFMTLFAVFRKKEDTECFGRRIEEGTVKYAATVLLMYLTFFLTGGIIISYVEQLPMLTCLFETASAIGTVGLTLGITPHLGILSRLILILLMFLGRVGGLTLVFAALSNKQRNVSRLPKERITVG